MYGGDPSLSVLDISRDLLAGDARAAPIGRLVGDIGLITDSRRDQDGLRECDVGSETGDEPHFEWYEGGSKLSQ